MLHAASCKILVSKQQRLLFFLSRMSYFLEGTLRLFVDGSEFLRTTESFGWTGIEVARVGFASGHTVRCGFHFDIRLVVTHRMLRKQVRYISVVLIVHHRLTYVLSRDDLFVFNHIFLVNRQFLNRWLLSQIGFQCLNVRVFGCLVVVCRSFHFIRLLLALFFSLVVFFKHLGPCLLIQKDASVVAVSDLRGRPVRLPHYSQVRGTFI